MCWVFSQTVSVTSHQCPEMLPGPFPAWFSCGWWLRGEEVGVSKPGSAMPCSLLVPCPVAMTSSALVFSFWSLSHCRLFPSALCLVDVTCFYLNISREAGLAVTALSTAAVVGGRSHHTEQASSSHTLCVHPKHSSAASLFVSPPCPQMIFTFSETWLSMMPGHHFKMCMAALWKILRERDE